MGSEEPDALSELQALKEILFRLSREAADYVGRYRRFRESFPEHFAYFAVLGCSVVSVHPVKGPVAPALKGQMELGTELAA